MEKNGTLRPGRLYIDMIKLVDGRLFKKEPELEKWFSAMARWIRSHYKKAEDTWIGSMAGRRLIEGARIVPNAGMVFIEKSMRL